ncbi:hypothetical protein AX17_002408 [Amanita inopinata Kibby_2008]|nr:hypothetical protein AX17_002408 [Amanita inopinata Kibby_2008]
MLLSLTVGFASVVLGAVSVGATGGFPPVTSPPGACGLDPADASCATVFEACVSTLKNHTDPFSNEACVAAASCYPTNPDAFLASLYCRFQGPSSNFTHSVSLPRVSNEVYSRTTVRGEFVSLESYTNWYKGVVTAANPNVTALIDPAFVTMSFDTILAWTGFCSSGEIQQQNFLDWFQYFSTVKGPGTTCGLVKNCPITNYPYTQDLLDICSSNQNAVSNPFSIDTCVAAALNWQDGINSFLQAVTCRYNIRFNNHLPAPLGNQVPPLSLNLTNQNPPYTQQNFIDFTYGALAKIGGAVRYPSTVDFVIKRWDLIVAWTNFCSTNAVPQKNLSDFLRYSADPITSTCPEQTCPPDPNASCQQLFESCLKAPTILTDPYANTQCVLAATCYSAGVKAFGNAISCAKNTFGRNANPQFWPRLTEATFFELSRNQPDMSQQNYIDAFYGALATLSSPIWPDVNYVIGRWTHIKTWAGFPSGNIPYKNFADYLQYS